MATNYKQRLAVLDAHVNYGVQPNLIANLMQITVMEVQDIIDVGEDYIGRPDLPRRRPAPKTDTTAADTTAPKTRARTATPAASDESKPAEEKAAAPIIPPRPRGDDGERATFNPGHEAA